MGFLFFNCISTGTIVLVYLLIFFLTDFKRCRLFVNSIFRWMGLFAILSVPLYVLGFRIQGISGLRDSLGARSGGFPFLLLSHRL